MVKTYPSIDPHSTPPPPPYNYAYKCQINSIACCDVITSQHALLILTGGNQIDLVRQQHVYDIWPYIIRGIVSAESTYNKVYATRLALSTYGSDNIYHNPPQNLIA